MILRLLLLGLAGVFFVASRLRPAFRRQLSRDLAVEIVGGSVARSFCFENRRASSRAGRDPGAELSAGRDPDSVASGATGSAAVRSRAIENATAKARCIVIQISEAGRWIARRIGPAICAAMK